MFIRWQNYSYSRLADESIHLAIFVCYLCTICCYWNIIVISIPCNRLWCVNVLAISVWLLLNCKLLIITYLQSTCQCIVGAKTAADIIVFMVLIQLDGVGTILVHQCCDQESCIWLLVSRPWSRSGVLHLYDAELWESNADWVALTL